MHFRKLTSTDYNEWKLLWDGYLTFYKTNVAETITTKTFERLLSESEPMNCILAESEGKVVGLVHFINHRSTWTSGDYCYLQDLFVSPDARKKGVGRALIEQVYDIAKENEYSRVYWLTQENNYQARMLYDSVAGKTDFVQYRKLIN